MADPIEWTILSRVAATVAGITPGGGYNYDFSATDAVIVGEAVLLPDVLPFACVAWAGNQTTHQERLGKYKPSTRIVVGLMVPYTSDTPGGRTRAALQAAYDVRKALESNRSLMSSPPSSADGIVYDLLVSSESEITGDEPDVPAEYAQILLTVEVWRERTAGAA